MENTQLDNNATVSRSGSAICSAARSEEETYFFSLEHEGKCLENKPIKISTYPGSSRIMTISVCDECYPIFWRDLDLTPIV